MNEYQEVFYGGFFGKILYYLTPEDFRFSCPRYINPDKTENLAMGIWFFSYVFFLVWVYYMTNRKKGIPSWYPEKLSLKGDNAAFTYSCIIASTPFVAYLSMWAASFVRRILMFAGCW